MDYSTNVATFSARMDANSNGLWIDGILASLAQFFVSELQFLDLPGISHFQVERTMFLFDDHLCDKRPG